MLSREKCQMTKLRRTFTLEFNREAASLVLDQGYSHIESARSRGLVESALPRWGSQLEQKRGGVTPTCQALTRHITGAGERPLKFPADLARTNGGKTLTSAYNAGHH